MYSLPVYQEFASLRPPLGGRTRLVYVNDICNSVPEVKIKLFADDTNVFKHGRDKDHVVTLANQCINKLHYWFLANKLCINIDKTCYTVFGPGRVDKDIKNFFSRH